MTSAIDPTKPTSGAALTADVRANFLAAKNEIEALQGGSNFVDAPADSVSYARRNGAWNPVLPTSGGTVTGALTIGATANNTLTITPGAGATNAVVLNPSGSGAVRFGQGAVPDAQVQAGQFTAN